jgi:hypothetical protein
VELRAQNVTALLAIGVYGIAVSGQNNKAKPKKQI